MKLQMITGIAGASVLGLTLNVTAAEDFWIKDPDTDCAIWTDEQPRETETASWSGECTDGKASGEGELVWVRDGALHGRYAGQMQDGRLHGDGALMVRADKVDGFDRVKGTFKMGLVDGTAVFIGANGDYFEGEASNDKMHGAGFWSDVAGNSYEGQFAENLPDGTGRFLAADGEEYIGEFRRGERHGFGLLYSADGSIYSGQFDTGKASGSGRFEDATGVYEGAFKDGKPDGLGTFTAADGIAYQGTFRSGKLTGTVLVTAPDGSKTVGEWKDGEKVK